MNARGASRRMQLKVHDSAINHLPSFSISIAITECVIARSDFPQARIMSQQVRVRDCKSGVPSPPVPTEERIHICSFIFRLFSLFLFLFLYLSLPFLSFPFLSFPFLSFPSPFPVPVPVLSFPLPSLIFFTFPSPPDLIAPYSLMKVSFGIGSNAYSSRIHGDTRN